MQFLKHLTGMLVITTLLFPGVTPLTGCSKKTIQYDTVSVVKMDTLVQPDSVYDIQDGLVAYYNFNAGSLKDGSMYGNNISFNNATPAADRFGTAGNAFYFDGATSYMQIPNTLSLNPNNITLLAIVKVQGFWTGSCRGNRIVGKGVPDATNGWYQIGFSDDLGCNAAIDSAHEKFGGGFGDNDPFGSAAGASTDTVFVQKDIWYHLLYSYDGITARFYINGILKNASPRAPVDFTNNTEDVFIGKSNYAGFDSNFKGVIDEIRIYNRALPQGAIDRLDNLLN